ncbi:MAG: single-stranded-DNA-specific exonuclease RecJ [Pseudomonadota bacterium]
MDYSDHRTFLDVKRSITGRRWVERINSRQANSALEMTQKFDVPDIVARVLSGRGVTPDGVLQFLEPSLRDLMPDPSVVTDLDAAAARLAIAINGKERVAIFGDYDVDGASASALLARFLRHFGIEAPIYIPDRIFEGYGPNPDAMKRLAEDADLIVTVDCGTNSGEAFAAIDGSGTDIVVIDHHQVGGPLPPVTAIVNPNREDDLSGLGYLCAAGVVFMTLVGTVRVLRGQGAKDVPDLLKMLDLVALATVCDVVPLVGLNRALVQKGLIVARHQHNPGMAALATAARIGEPLAPFHFGYVLGPRINAGGRIGDASLGARLLTTETFDEAKDLAAQLDQLNRERQGAEAVMVEEAKAGVAAEMASGNPPPVIVTASDQWHPGIVGLIAARLKEAHNRPAFAISFDGSGRGTGSGRSVLGFDLGKLVRGAVEEGLLIKGGGHAMAAGLTVERAKLAAVRAYFEEKSSSVVQALADNAVLTIDAALSSGGANLELIDAIEKAGPYGSGHDQPVFAFRSHQLQFARVVGNGHVKATIAGQGARALDAIAFRAADDPLGQTLLQGVGTMLHFAGTLSINRYNGREIPQLRITDAAKPD